MQHNKQSKTKRETMTNKFDDLTKSMAQSVTRRAALRKFSVGLAGMALACFGLARKAEARLSPNYCRICMQNCKGSGGSEKYCKEACRDWCG
jgi:hypothetical protein